MMRDDIILKLQRIIEGNDRITWDLFPEIYDGFLEADELSKAEDRMLQFVASAVLTCTNDKLISTASVDRIAEYESALGVSGSGLSLDARRQQVIDYINRSRTINESTMHALCQSLALDCTVYERTDSQALTLGVFTEEDAEDGSLPAVGIVGEIRPTVPQNLALYAGVDTAVNRPVVVSHAHFSALWAGLGTVERHELPPLIAGLMGNDELRLYAEGSMERGTIDYPERSLTENHDVYGDKIEVWHSSYTPHPVVFPEAAGEEPSAQFACGTIRKWGTKANRCIAIEDVDSGWMSAGAVIFPERELAESHEVYGDKIEVWHSSYTPHAVVFPEATGEEPSAQFACGTIRKWGTKANRGVELALVDGDSMELGEIIYPERELTGNNEVYGDTLKIYTKQYTPVIIVFPDKPQTEPGFQMVGGTVRVSGNKANRGISLENISGQIMPN